MRDLRTAYVDLWARQLRAVRPDVSLPNARARAHAAFGLLNSTPRISGLNEQELAVVLQEMALAALASLSA